MSDAPLSPATRGGPGLKARVRRLERFEKSKPPTFFNFEKEVGCVLWERHWRYLERLVTLMHQCEVTAREMRGLIRASLTKKK